MTAQADRQVQTDKQVRTDKQRHADNQQQVWFRSLTGRWWPFRRRGRRRADGGHCRINAEVTRLILLQVRVELLDGCGVEGFYAPADRTRHVRGKRLDRVISGLHGRLLRLQWAT